MTDLRNIAIIAHVDHGKTTLVDQMLAQSGAIRSNQQVEERAMDSNALERERGITILAKCTSVEWKDTRINIVDTPGHADFGGEVERILSMVDGVILLVDASEGPMPQTKFVTSKALSLGLKPIVILNKADRPDTRGDEVHDEIFDLFVSLGANDDQLDFPMLYASGRDGWASENPEQRDQKLSPLFDLIVEKIPAPDIDAEAANRPFAMLATTLEADPFLGRILTGRIQQGTLKPNQNVHTIAPDGNVVEKGRITKVLAFRGLTRQPIDNAGPGDIIAVSGLSNSTVANTICDPEINTPIKALPIDPPTLAMTFSINDSPLAGTEGKKVQSRVIRERLLREQEGNVAIRISDTPDRDSFEVAGRGELQLGILIETMRREGFELSISRPRVLTRQAEDGSGLEEPMEEVTVDVDEEYAGVVIEKMTTRKGQLIDIKTATGGKSRLLFECPTRGLIGYHGEFLTDTRGSGVLNRQFKAYGPHAGEIPGRRTGTLISNGQGTSVAYALWNLEERGSMFIEPGEKVYQGMIIGENSRSNDLDVNPLRSKQLTNIRAAGKDDAIRLTPPRRFSLEEAIAYIEDDELVEVTPENIRLRKKYLLPHERKRRSA